MTPDTFAGMWFENGGQDLMVGYVGDPPDLGDLPGVTALVARPMSLAEMEALAAERNQDEDVGYRWTVKLPEGTVERRTIETVFAGDLIQDREYCSTSIPKWLDHADADADFWASWVSSQYPDGYRILHCIDDDHEESWTVWRLTPDGAERMPDQPSD